MIKKSFPIFNILLLLFCLNSFGQVVIGEELANDSIPQNKQKTTDKPKLGMILTDYKECPYYKKTINYSKSFEPIEGNIRYLDEASTCISIQTSSNTLAELNNQFEDAIIATLHQTINKETNNVEDILKGNDQCYEVIECYSSSKIAIRSTIKNRCWKGFESYEGYNSELPYSQRIRVLYNPGSYYIEPYALHTTPDDEYGQIGFYKIDFPSDLEWHRNFHSGRVRAIYEVLNIEGKVIGAFPVYIIHQPDTLNVQLRKSNQTNSVCEEVTISFYATGATQYILKRKEEESNTWLNDTIPWGKFSHTIKNLDPTVNYEFKIWASNEGGWVQSEILQRQACE